MGSTKRAWPGLLLLVACSGGGDPGPQPYNGPPTNLPAGEEAPSNANGETQDLAAVLTVMSNGFCSAALIDVGGADDAPAYALTAGHCTGAPWSAHSVTVDAPFEGSGATANDFWDTWQTDASIHLEVSRIEYSTMHVHDLGILRLQESVGELRRLGLTPYPLADALPEPGKKISIVGHPNGDSLRRSTCTASPLTFEAEDEFWMQSSPNGCPDIAPGSSGSPVFDGKGRIWGVVSTASGTAVPCSLDNPCDMASVGLVNALDTSYAAPAVGLNGCFKDGVFALEQETCPLPRHSAVEPNELPARYVASTEDMPGAWNVNLSNLGFSHYRYQVGDAHDVRCENEAGYGEALAIADAPVITDPLPTAESLQLLCLQLSHDGTTFPPVNEATTLLSEVNNSGLAAVKE